MSYFEQDQPTLPSEVLTAKNEPLHLTIEPGDPNWIDRLLRHLRHLYRRSEYYWLGLRHQLRQVARRWPSAPSFLRGRGRPVVWTVSALLAAQMVTPLALAQNPLGSEFRVNTYTTSYQDNPSVAMDADGNFVVVWQSDNQPGGNGYDIYAQRYNAAGVAQGAEFRVNSYTTNSQYNPSVAMDADGDFVVAWYSSNQPDGNYDDIYAQRYNAAGVAQGAEFRVNTYTTSYQSDPSVAMDADGNFVVAWYSSNQPGGNGYDIYAQRYNAAGVAQGAEFPVNTYTTNGQVAPSVAMDAGGDFVVAWNGEGQGGNFSDIYAQRYNAAGVAQGSEFLVDSYTTDSQYNPSVAMDADGDFVVAWQSYNQLGNSSYEIYAQRYNAAGVAQGAEFLVNSYTTNSQSYPSVAMDSDGNFVIAWQSTGQDGDDAGTYEENTYARRYAQDGTAQDTQEFRVNTYTESDQISPAVAAQDAGGDFVVAWSSYGQDGDGVYESNIYTQRYGLRYYFPIIFKNASP